METCRHYRFRVPREVADDLRDNDPQPCPVCDALPHRQKIEPVSGQHEVLFTARRTNVAGSIVQHSYPRNISVSSFGQTLRDAGRVLKLILF